MTTQKPITPTREVKFHGVETEYDKAQKAAKIRFAKALFKLQFEEEYILTFNDTTLVKKNRNSKSKTVIENFHEMVLVYVKPHTWLELPKSMRYEALHLLSAAKTNVPGGVVYTVRPLGDSHGPMYVFLNVAHDIGTCDIILTVPTARVH